MKDQLDSYTKQFFEGLGYYATETYGGKSGQDSYGLVFRTYQDDKYDNGSTIYEYHAKQIALEVMIRERKELRKLSIFLSSGHDHVFTRIDNGMPLTQPEFEMMLSKDLAELEKLKEELE